MTYVFDQIEYLLLLTPYHVVTFCFIVLFILFLYMVYPAYSTFEKNFNSEPFQIRKDYHNNPRIFSEKIRRSFDNKTAHGITKKIEHFVAQERKYNEILYSVQDPVIENKTVFNSIISDGYISLPPNSKVINHIDGKKGLMFGDGCIVNGNATSLGMIELGQENSFRSVYGFPIITNFSPKENMNLPQIYDIEKGSISEFNIFMSKKLVTLPPNTSISSDMIIKGDIIIYQNSLISKTIKSQSRIQLLENVTVEGNLIAYGDVIVGPNCHVKGHIICEKTLTVCSGAVLGEENKIKTFIALEEITLHGNVQVYGYLKTSVIGKTLSS